MSLYALTAAGLQRINRKVFGVPIPTELQRDANGNMVPVEGGATTDPGVDELKRELMAGLSATDPVQLQGAFQLAQDQGEPALQIFVDNRNGTSVPVIQFVNHGANSLVNLMADGSMQFIQNAFNTLGSAIVTTNDTNVNYTNQPTQPGGEASSVQPSTVTQLTDLGGYTGSVTIVTAWAVNISSCTVTLSASTSQTLTFLNGRLVGVR